MNVLIRKINAHPVLAFIIICVALFQVYSIWQSKGATLIIESPEPAEDFLVLCTWHKEGFFLGGHSSGNYRSDYKVIVTESNKKVSCGWSIWGGSSGLSSMHPIYSGDGKEYYTKNGAKHIVYNKTKLDVLNEQKTKFEAGYWDKYSNPGFQYANSVGNCGFGFPYLDKYSKAKKVDREHFKELYNKPMEECLTRVYKIYKKYRPKSSGQYTDGKTRMKKLWNSDKWSKYK